MRTESSSPRLLNPASDSARNRIGDQIARSVVLVVLFAVPALMCLHAAVMSDPDVWWHLRTGEWILEHRAFPHADPFSIFGMGKPWTAYSWLFDLLILKLFRHWGLVGIAVYTSAMVAAITAALYRLIERRQSDFAVSVLLTVAGVVCLSGILTPRPWMFSILFFVLEVDILMQARETGKVRELLWLPFLFAFWANIHIQFVDGLVVLGIAAAEPVAERWWLWRKTQLRADTAWAIFGACILGTLLNPYGWRIYQTAYELVSQSGVANIITELKALEFRDASDFVLLFMPLVAAATIAWSRRPPFFESAMLAIAAYLSFHSMRDRWLMAVVACAILASALPADEEQRRGLPAFALPAILTAVAALLAGGVVVLGLNQTRLNASLAEEMPVGAVDAVKQKGLRGRLFNDYDWGGYLIWSLRQPVSIDGRSTIHGDDRIARNVASWSGKPDWASDPDLEAAGLVIAPVQLPLTQLLRLDPDFSLVYEDKVAAVFQRRGSQPSSAEPETALPTNATPK
jgi:hypothetical protein